MKFHGYLSIKTASVGEAKVDAAEVVYENEDGSLGSALYKAEFDGAIATIKTASGEVELHEIEGEEITALSLKSMNMKMKQVMRKYKNRPSKPKKLLCWYIEKRAKKGLRGARHRAVIYYLQQGKVRVKYQSIPVKGVPKYDGSGKVVKVKDPKTKRLVPARVKKAINFSRKKGKVQATSKTLSKRMTKEKAETLVQKLKDSHGKSPDIKGAGKHTRVDKGNARKESQGARRQPG